MHLKGDIERNLQLRTEVLFFSVHARADKVLNLLLK